MQSENNDLMHEPVSRTKHCDGKSFANTKEKTFYQWLTFTMLNPKILCYVNNVVPDQLAMAHRFLLNL